MNDKKGGESHWNEQIRRGLESGDPAYRMLVSSLMISVAAMESAHRAQSEAQALTTPSAAELRDRYGCDVVVAGSDVLDDKAWEQPDPTVAEKWAEHIGNRAANLEWMAQAIGTQVGEHEWRTARTQLRAMRDEIERALAEIEPLAVEQGGRNE